MKIFFQARSIVNVLVLQSSILSRGLNYPTLLRGGRRCVCGAEGGQGGGGGGDGSEVTLVSFLPLSFSDFGQRIN